MPRSIPENLKEEEHLHRYRAYNAVKILEDGNHSLAKTALDSEISWWQTNLGTADLCMLWMRKNYMRCLIGLEEYSEAIDYGEETLRICATDDEDIESQHRASVLGMIGVCIIRQYDGVEPPKEWTIASRAIETLQASLDILKTQFDIFKSQQLRQDMDDTKSNLSDAYRLNQKYMDAINLQWEICGDLESEMFREDRDLRALTARLRLGKDYLLEKNYNEAFNVFSYIKHRLSFLETGQEYQAIRSGSAIGIEVCQLVNWILIDDSNYDGVRLVDSAHQDIEDLVKWFLALGTPSDKYDETDAASPTPKRWARVMEIIRATNGRYLIAVLEDSCTSEINDALHRWFPDETSPVEASAAEEPSSKVCSEANSTFTPLERLTISTQPAMEEPAREEIASAYPESFASSDAWPTESVLGDDHKFVALLDIETAAGQDKKTEEYLTEFYNFCKTLSNWSANPDIRKVRIAVIDTGVDAAHPYIRAKWKRPQDGYREFLDPQNGVAESTVEHEPGNQPIDNDGHGTFIAGLVVKYAPNADLYIARVANTRASMKKDESIGKRIAEAITYAIKVWEVNIISLSIGLQDKCKAIMKSLLNLRTPERDVMLFAAASNFGITRSILFPASDPRVFSVHATTGYGGNEETNAREPENDTQFSMLGKCVRSTWPEALKDGNGVKESKAFYDGAARYMSGTSVATPLLASLIATLYAFSRNHTAYIEHIDSTETFDGVNRLLRAMCPSTREGLKIVVPYRGYNEEFRKKYKNERKLAELISDVVSS